MIHTSDWHLGRRFHQVGMLDAQARFVDFLVELVREHACEAVLVSGDVYDRALPTPDTVALLDEALTRLVDAGAQVVLISGNHDSPTRLGFGSRLLDRAGVHVRCDVAQSDRPVLIGDTAVYALPYLEPSVVAEPIGASARSHAAVLDRAMQRVRADLSGRRVSASVVLAHAFVAGAVASDSERDIAVGGVSVVPADVFSGVTYAALGHLHRAQTVRPGVVYSGAPLPMSFADSDLVASVSVVEVGRSGVQAQVVPTPVHRRLAVLRGELEALLADPSLHWAEAAYCQVVLTDAARPLGALERLLRRFPHTLRLEFEPIGAVRALSARRHYAQRSAATSELEVCAAFLSHVRGGSGPDATEVHLLTEALEAARVSQALADPAAAPWPSGAAPRVGVA